MGKALSEMSLEELWQLFPIFLTAHQKQWEEWYEIEAARLCCILPADEGIKIHHIGSTAIKEIWAKPIVDILVEIPNAVDMADIKEILVKNGYIVMIEDKKRMSLNKGYTENGFAEQVFHLHIRYSGDHDELYFRDYMNDHPVLAKAYEKMKLSLWKQYENNRDAYTESKGDFIKHYTEEARKEYGARY